MISLEEVRRNILERIPVLPAEKVELSSANGRTLASPVQSADAIPPFDNTAMDGFVVSVICLRRCVAVRGWVVVGLSFTDDEPEASSRM